MNEGEKAASSEKKKAENDDIKLHKKNSKPARVNKNACGGLAWHGEENFFAFQFLNCSTQQHHNAEAGEQTQKKTK